MNAIIKAIYNILVADETLATLLSNYNDLPAIFSDDIVPSDATPPWAHISITGDDPDDTITTFGRDVQAQVAVWLSASDGSKKAYAIAERARVLLHDQELSVDGFEYIFSIASGPIPNDSPDDEMIGRVVFLRVVVEEE